MQPGETSLPTEEARRLLRQAGLRSTSCRVAVLEHLARAANPLSHADVAEMLVPDGYDQSTIFRCLVDMAEAGLVARLDLGDHLWRFEFRGRYEPGSADHPHFLCVDCGKVSCLTEVDVKITPAKGPRRRQGDSPVGEVSEVLLKGHCAECL